MGFAAIGQDFIDTFNLAGCKTDQTIGDLECRGGAVIAVQLF
jgi:hypothetical protein